MVGKLLWLSVEHPILFIPLQKTVRKAWIRINQQRSSSMCLFFFFIAKLSTNQLSVNGEWMFFSQIYFYILTTAGSVPSKPGTREAYSVRTPIFWVDYHLTSIPTRSITQNSCSLFYLDPFWCWFQSSNTTLEGFSPPMSAYILSPCQLIRNRYDSGQKFMTTRSLGCFRPRFEICAQNDQIRG
jgi:hypothetical protein